MAPPTNSNYRRTMVLPTGQRRIGNWKRTSWRIWVPAGMWPCLIEENLTVVKMFGKEVHVYETEVTDRNGIVTRYQGKCPQFVEVGGRVRAVERNHDNDFARRPQLQPEGNRNGWLSEEEEADSDLESTASNSI